MTEAEYELEMLQKAHQSLRKGTTNVQYSVCLKKLVNWAKGRELEWDDKSATSPMDFIKAATQFFLAASAAIDQHNQALRDGDRAAEALEASKGKRGRPSKKLERPEHFFTVS
jgi:hypothetical protein